MIVISYTDIGGNENKANSIYIYDLKTYSIILISNTSAFPSSIYFWGYADAVILNTFATISSSICNALRLVSATQFVFIDTHSYDSTYVYK